MIVQGPGLTVLRGDDLHRLVRIFGDLEQVEVFGIDRLVLAQHDLPDPPEQGRPVVLAHEDDR